MDQENIQSDADIFLFEGARRVLDHSPISRNISEIVGQMGNAITSEIYSS
jgi:hypothetical protein